ncbi:MAG: DUF262 domain-containing protein [Gammaproteobacteria bacterium]|nr:DUF262 domain-containing protein [Gammaproteobacteria bacterium]
MTVKPYDIRTFADVLSDLRKEQLVVPNFQRDFEWERAKQHRLAASVLCGLPIGGMVMFSGGGKDFAHRRLCSTNPVESEREEVTYLLDGQQRLATLRSLFDDPFADRPTWEEAWDFLHAPLQTRWYLSLLADRRPCPCFGSRDEAGEPALNHSEAIRLPLEPADILDRIVPNRVTKRAAQGTPPWWHPAFAVQSGVDPVRVRRKIAKQAAREEAIPLWEIAGAARLKENGRTPLHELAIREIALDLEKELRSRLQDDSEDTPAVTVAAQAEPALRDELRPLDEIQRLLMNASSTWTSKVVQSLENLMHLQIPTITVEGELRRAVTIFENINEGGTPLTVFDLVNAKAVPGFEQDQSLRSRVRRELGDTRPPGLPSGLTIMLPSQYIDALPRSLVTGVSSNSRTPAHIRNQYLNLLSIYGHSQDPRSCDSELRVEYIKKDRQLALTAPQINGSTELACTSLLRACLFLQTRVGKVKPEACSYALMLLPLAGVLGNDELFGRSAVWRRLEYWYWVSLLGGRYRERQNEVAVRDVRNVYDWCADKVENPFERYTGRVLGEGRYSDKDTFLLVDDTQQVPQAVAEGLLDFTLAGRPRDFLPTGWSPVTLNAAGARAMERVKTTDGNGEEQEYRMELAAHHIVPLASVTRIDDLSVRLRSKRESLYNSPLNKTRISKFANEKLGGRSPGEYFGQLPLGTLRRHHVGLGGPDIMQAICDDDPFAASMKEEGIREVLSSRFDTVRNDIEGRLDKLSETW